MGGAVPVMDPVRRDIAARTKGEYSRIQDQVVSSLTSRQDIAAKLQPIAKRLTAKSVMALDVMEIRSRQVLTRQLSHDPSLETSHTAA